MINELEPLENLELPTKDVQLEHNTLYAAMLEREIRFQDDIKFMIVPPQVFVSLSSPEGIQADYGGENQKFIQGIKLAKHAFVAVWAGRPDHYTYLELEQVAGHGVVQVV